MKALGRTLAVAMAIALVGVALAAVFWVAHTTEGATWLLTSAPPLVGVEFSARKIEGSIIGHLQLTKVRVGLGRQKVEIDRLELSWKPLLLLAGTVGVQELDIRGVRIQDDSPIDNKTPDLAWPKVSEIGKLFDGRIARLLVTNIQYRRLQEQPVQITSLSGSVAWQGGTLSVSDLKAVFPAGRINGTLAAGFSKPSLTADLAVVLAQPLAEMDQFKLQAGRSKEGGPEPFVGKITIAGSAGTRKLLEISADVGMATNAFNLRRLTLNRADRKGLITADGSLAFTTPEPVLTMQIKVDGLDLAPDLNVPTNLSGTLKITGTLDSYRGDFTIANQAHGWQAVSVSAVCQGTREGMKLSPLTATVIDGSLTGNLDMNWKEEFTVQGTINGRNLNPARIAPDWQGAVNFNAAGKLIREGTSPVAGSVSVAILESRLHGQALTGQLKADFAGNNLSIARLALKGKGFDLLASGELNQRITLAADISDLSRLLPGSAGTFKAEGWLRWCDEQLSGALAGTGSRLVYAGTRIAAANLTARLEQGPGYPLHVSASLRDVVYDAYKLDAVSVEADGTMQRHRVNATLRSGGSEARFTLNAGYNDGFWKGEISRLAGRDSNGPWNQTAPAAFAVSARKFSLSPLSISAGASERLEASADLSFNPSGGQVRAQWSGLNLARANPWLTDMQISGRSHGTVRLGFLAGNRMTLAGNASGSGTFSGQGSSITIQRSQVTFDGGEKGMQGVFELGTPDGGSLKGTFSSPVPLSPVMPEKGDLTAELSGIDLALLKPWLPADTVLEGRISGRAKGIMLPGKRFELDGNAILSGGALRQKRPDGELNLSFKSATTSWSWRGEALSGTLALIMAEYGQAQGTFQLPVPARFPVSVNPKGSLRAALAGHVKENGIITVLFPELVQESSGVLDAELGISGTWDMPQFGGKVQLTKAAAYLPSAGIHLKDVQLTAHLGKDLIRIDSFRAVSGPGHIEGTALLTLAGWRVINYQGTIRGENFQTVYFPELQILSTPNLRFEGTPKKLTLRGELRLPELHIVGAESHAAVAPSSDVIREGSIVQPDVAPPLELDVQVRVLLGEKVFAKVAGINAQLGGTVDLSMSSLDKIASKGEIKVVKGRYRTYGVNLEIVRGRLFFSGGAINRPTLDILALRTVGSIRAGVTVAGTLQRPVTKLYSEPAMPDVDVLAYIVLGHPLGSNGQQASLVAQAAGALLTSSKAAVLQDQIKNKLGLSTLEIQGGVGGTGNSMGYKTLQVTPPGAMPEAQQSGITETVLTVGKYLTPQLYISYGKSLFTGSNLFRLRYDIFKNWQIETQTGSGESGADLYYKMEFK